MKRDQWLQEAVNAEHSGSIITCRSIIKETMLYGMEEQLESVGLGPDSSEKDKVKAYKTVWV